VLGLTKGFSAEGHLVITKSLTIAAMPGVTVDGKTMYTVF
jgi:hypothetical protein